MKTFLNGAVEIDEFFNKKCFCLGIEVHWTSYSIEIEVLFFRWSILIWIER